MKIQLFCLLIPVCMYSMDEECHKNDTDKFVAFDKKYSQSSPLDDSVYEECKALVKEQNQLALVNVIRSKPYDKARHYIAGIIKAGVNPNSLNGQSLLEYALNRDDYCLVKNLLEHGADVNENMNFFKYPIQHARHLGIAQLLVEGGAKVKYDDEYNQNILHMICLKDFDPRLIAYYIEKGVGVLEYSTYGFSPLHSLALYCSDEQPICEIKKKASLLIEGLTPQEIINLLSKNDQYEPVIDTLKKKMTHEREVLGETSMNDKKLLEYLEDALEQAHIEKAQQPENCNQFKVQMTILAAVFKKRKELVCKHNNC